MAVEVRGLLAAWCWAVALLPAHAGEGRTPVPVIEKGRAGTQCVADPATMRREHPAMLRHRRDDTVRHGMREAPGLKNCIDCHASAATASVAEAPGDFCVSCHRYAAVRIDCFECHTARRGPAAQASEPRGAPAATAAAAGRP